MYPAWGSVAGEKGRGGSPRKHQCLNISLVYTIVLGYITQLWYPVPLEDYMFWALRSKSARIYIYSEGPLMHILYCMKGAGQLEANSLFWLLCQMLLALCCLVLGGASGICSGIPLSPSAHLYLYDLLAQAYLGSKESLVWVWNICHDKSRI